MKELRRRPRKLRLLYILPCFTLFTTLVLTAELVFWSKDHTGEAFTAQRSGSRNLQAVDGISQECIPPSINSFPGDFFTQEERLRGGVVIHFLIVIYLCAMLAIICDEYFVPSLESISERLKLSTDVAGATFMAIGTSSPELFSSIIGSFITEGDIGVGTIVGSAVFNILGVTGLSGLVLWGSELDIDWYPISRDCSVYVTTVAALIAIISNNIVTWWESLIMLIMYGMYTVLMYYNRTIEKFSHRQAERLKEFWKKRMTRCEDEEKSPLLGGQVFPSEIREKKPLTHQPSRDSFSVDIPVAREDKDQAQVKGAIDQKKAILEEEDDNDGSLCSPPKRSAGKFTWWLIMWPASLLFYVTVPDCRKEKWKNWFAVTFLIAVVWIGLLSYLTVWMVTIIGFTLSIPDTISGLTILAAGTSIPEIISSVIVVKEGFGNMAICNLIGSNIFDILFCLGAPWLIKTLSSDGGFLVINSSALTYTTATLLSTVVAIYAVFHVSHWKLNRAVGFACIVIYAMFLSLACMYELNFFGDFNPPTCTQ